MNLVCELNFSKKIESKICFITAVYGSYELSCKKFAPQTVNTDFICFTDNPNIISNGWIIDTTPYHILNRSKLDTGEYVNSFDNKLKYKLEKICSNSVFVAKKRYALNVYSNEGVVYSEPKIKITGLEIVKSSSPAIVRSALKDCMKMILNEEKEKLQTFVSEFRGKFNISSVEEIAFPRGVNGISK